MQNCPHMHDGWCLGCVMRLGNAVDDLLQCEEKEPNITIKKLRVKAALCNTELHEYICIIEKQEL